MTIFTPTSVILYVEDVNTSTAFYRRALGEEPVETFEGFAVFALTEDVTLGLQARDGIDPAAVGAPGSGDDSSRQSPATCSSCGYFVPLRGSLGTLFGACANEYSPSDACVVSLEHGCGGHSDVVAAERARELPAPVFDTIGIDEQLFD